MNCSQNINTIQIDHNNFDGHKALIQAIKSGDLETVKELKDKYISVDAANEAVCNTVPAYDANSITRDRC